MGTITFYYFNIPKSPSQVKIPFYTAENYSVIIGLEDSAYKHLNDGLYSVNINETNMLSHHIIVFKQRETCIGMIKLIVYLKFHLHYFRCH